LAHLVAVSSSAGRSSTTAPGLRSASAPMITRAPVCWWCPRTV